MKTAVITGGAGGIGKAAVTRFARAGWRVFSCDVAAQDNPAEGVIPLRVDLTDSGSVAAAARSVAEACERVDALIHLAGIHRMASLVEVEEEAFIRSFDVNLFGPYRATKAFLPLLSGGRVIVVTSELATLKPLPFTGLYAITKTALDAYARSLRMELALLGIPVIILRPGAHRSPMSEGALDGMERLAASTALFRGATERMRALISAETGSAADPDRLARTILSAAETRRPRLEASPRRSARLALLSALPERARIAIVKWILK